jgi:hypothetical protein
VLGLPRWRTWRRARSIGSPYTPPQGGRVELLIDEWQSQDLKKPAQRRGDGESSHVAWLGLAADEIPCNLALNFENDGAAISGPFN